MQSTMIRGPQGSLAVFVSEVTGGGLPVLLVHGDSSRALQWEGVWGRLAGEVRLVALDLRGHGASGPAADGDYGYAGRAEDALAAAEAVGLDRFVVVAHSGGAAVALALGARHPERVAGILMVDPATDPRLLPQEVRDGFVSALAGPKSLEAQKEYFASIVGTDPALRERVLRDAEAVHPAARLGVGQALAAWNLEPALDAFRGPLRILATDVTDGPAALYRLRPSISHAVVHGTGHWLQIEDPDRVAREVLAFQRRVSAGKAPE